MRLLLAEPQREAHCSLRRHIADLHSSAQQSVNYESQIEKTSRLQRRLKFCCDWTEISSFVQQRTLVVILMISTWKD